MNVYLHLLLLILTDSLRFWKKFRCSNFLINIVVNFILVYKRYWLRIFNAVSYLEITFNVLLLRTFLRWYTYFTLTYVMRVQGYFALMCVCDKRILMLLNMLCFRKAWLLKHKLLRCFDVTEIDGLQSLYSNSFSSSKEWIRQFFVAGSFEHFSNYWKYFALNIQLSWFITSILLTSTNISNLI